MAFIAADINKRSLMRKENQLQFQMIIKSNIQQANASKISTREQSRAAQQAYLDTQYDKKVAANGGNTSGISRETVEDISLDSYYQGLKALDEQYSLEMESLESELEVVKANRESLEKLVQNNISQDCALWCVGGSG